MADWQAIRAGSSVLAGIDRSSRMLRTAADDSWILARLGNAERVLGHAATHSRIGAAGRTFGRWTRNAWLYRWLTAEPEQDIVVIDLRETWTIGPVLTVLDRLTDWTGQQYHESPLDAGLETITATVESSPLRVVGLVAIVALVVNTLATALIGTLTESGLGVRFILLAVALLATRVDASWTELQESRLGRTLAAVFTPPEPPEKESPATDELSAPSDENESLDPPDDG